MSSFVLAACAACFLYCGAALQIISDGNHSQQTNAKTPALEFQSAASVTKIIYPEVVVYIAFGSAATSRLFGGSIETLGTLGGWVGPVLVITDDEECVKKQLVPRAKRVGLNLTILSIQIDHDVSAIKEQKAKISEHLNTAGLHGIKSYMYMDVDILVGAPVQNLRPRIADAHATNTQAEMFVFPQHFRKSYPTEKLHTGLIVAKNTKASAACMRQWGNMIASRKYGRDQTALMATQCAEDGKWTTIEDDIFKFPDLESLQNGKLTTFMHFTRTYRMQSPKLHTGIMKFWHSQLGLDGNPFDLPTCQALS